MQVAFEYVYLMFQSAVGRFEKAKAQIATLDPEDHKIASKYVEGLGFLCRLALMMALSFTFETDGFLSGLTRWYFETNRYFGPNRREVKETMKLDLLPLEECASRPLQTLTYAVNDY